MQSLCRQGQLALVYGLERGHHQYKQFIQERAPLHHRYPLRLPCSIWLPTGPGASGASDDISQCGAQRAGKAHKFLP
jgi:hypothetical protein